MAREYAQVRLAMWSDDDVRALSPRAQHLYFVLLTSPSLSHCGVGDWRPGRIAAFAFGWTAEAVEMAAAELVERLFIVVDDATEEYLVRSFVRHDGLMKQPKMATAMASALAAVASCVLRGVVVHELKRLREEFPDLRGWGSEKAAELLSKASVDPSAYPLGRGSGKGSVKGSTEESGTGSVNGSVKGFGNPKPTPSVKESGKGSPTPAPTPTPATSTYSDSLRESGAAAPTTITAQTVVGAWVDANRENGVDPSRTQIGQVAKLAGDLLGRNDPAAVLVAATAAGTKGYVQIDRELTVGAGRNKPRPITYDVRAEE